MAGGTEAECRIVRIDTRLCPSVSNVCALKFFLPTICAKRAASVSDKDANGNFFFCRPIHPHYIRSDRFQRAIFLQVPTEPAGVDEDRRSTQSKRLEEPFHVCAMP